MARAPVVPLFPFIHLDLNFTHCDSVFVGILKPVRTANGDTIL
jgi:hypothetical protein